MANLVIPRREICIKQPGQSSKLQLTHPLARTLTAAYVPSIEFQSELVSGAKNALPNYQPNRYVGRNGEAYRLTSGHASSLRFAIPDRGAVSNSLFAFVEFDDLTSIGEIISVGGAYATKLYKRGAYLEAVSLTNSSVKVTSTTAIELNRVYSVCVTDSYPGTDLRLWIDGRLDCLLQNASTRLAGHSAFSSLYSANPRGYRLYGAFAWAREIAEAEIRSLSENPWQIFAPRETRLFVTASSGSVNATAFGSFSPLSLTPQTAIASGSASASGSLAAITLSAPTATASAGGSATASGSFAALSISPATATATATKSANATGAPAQITISHATAIAIGSAVATGGYQSIGITAPTGVATSAGNAQAIAAFATLSINPATGAAYGSAIAIGSLPVISVSPATGTASTGSFTGAISDADITRIVQAVLAALNATTIPVDTRKMNGAAVIGDGSEAQPWRGFGVQP